MQKNIISKVVLTFNKLYFSVYIFLFSILIRIPDLGYDVITDDLENWRDRGYRFGSALIDLNFGATAPSYHPGITLLYNQFISNKIVGFLTTILFDQLNQQQEFLLIHTIQKTTLIIFTSILLTIAYYYIRKITNLKTAVISIIIINLEPFYLALTRVIHTDAILSLFMFLSALSIYNYLINTKNLKEVRLKQLSLASLFTAFAILTKSSALYLLAFWGLNNLIIFIRELNKSKTIKQNILINSILFVIITLIFFILFWPAMWSQPISTLQLFFNKGINETAYQDGHTHIWFGKETSDPGILFYPLVLISKYTFYLFLLFSTSSIMYLYNYSKGKTHNNLILYMLTYITFFLLMITLVSKKLDRYTLPILFPMSVVVAIFASKYITYKSKLMFVAITAFIFYKTVVLYSIHPNYILHYSVLAGGIDNGRYIIEPKWPGGLINVAKYFNSKENPEDITVAISNYSNLRPFGKFTTVNIKHETEAITADYFVLPTHRKKRNKEYKKMYNLEKIDSIKISKISIYDIYKYKGKK